MRETKNNLLIIQEIGWSGGDEIKTIITETIELISIFSKSITTTQKTGPIHSFIHHLIFIIQNS